MKMYMFTVTLREGSDEWWESNPTHDEVLEEVFAALDTQGFDVDITLTGYTESVRKSQ